MTRVHVGPDLLEWACERAGLTTEIVTRRFPALKAWIAGETDPTLKQLERFTTATHTPIGFMFLSKPPAEDIPIPDFRTIANKRVRIPSADILDTIYICQQRQDWYREYARTTGGKPLDFVASASLSDDVARTAARIRTQLSLSIEERRELPTWTDALRRFIEAVDSAGVLAMVSGVVASNNRRKLDPADFRGFALVDDVAPLVFVNGSDSKAAQMFTLAHELAHIWLGQSALSDSAPADVPHELTERWCNEVAAELLVPLDALRQVHESSAKIPGESERLARYFKVSSLVILRRMHDSGWLTDDAFWQEYNSELARLRLAPKGSGGNFYLTLGARVSKRFARSLVVSTLEGRSTFSEAFRLLGFKKMSTFHELGRSLGLAV